MYRDDEDHVVTVLLAPYSDPDAGVYHSPTNCYRSNGWRIVEDSKVDVPVPGGTPQRVYLSTWEFKGDTVLVTYWYRLGDHTLFER